MGGRNEVIASPAVELLKFMELALEKDKEELEQEKARLWLQYLSNIFSNTPQGKEDPKFTQSRREFEEMLRPELPPNEAEYKWDFEQLDRLRAPLKGG